MAMTNAYRDYISSVTVGNAVTAFNNANSFLGVGDSTAVFAATQTDLQAATNKLRKAMEATYPTLATNVITFRSLFGTAEANFAWAEWGVFNASTAGTMMSRKVEALGTKTSSQSWQLTATITINAG